MYCVIIKGTFCYLSNAFIVITVVVCVCCFVTGDDCYDVEAIPSDDMSRLQAKGKLILKLSHDEIKLAQASSLAMVATWPLNSLRRYVSENGVFTIEMGRRSPRGAGLYSFKTIQDGELFDKVRLLINRAAITPQNTLLNKTLLAGKDVVRDDVAAATSAGFDIDSRPPAPLPLTSYPPPPLPPKDNVLDDVDSGGIRLGYGSVTKAQLQYRQTLLAKVRKNSFSCVCMKYKPCAVTVCGHVSNLFVSSHHPLYNHKIMKHFRCTMSQSTKWTANTRWRTQILMLASIFMTY